VTLIPFPFPADLFEKAKGLASDFNALYMGIANDYDWLCENINKFASLILWFALYLNLFFGPFIGRVEPLMYQACC
jgi:hypothetical protein